MRHCNCVFTPICFPYNVFAASAQMKDRDLSLAAAMSKLGRRRVAVLAGSSLGWREMVMHGIASYAHENGPWHVYTAPEGAEESIFFTPRYQWDGLIVRVTSRLQAKRIRALRVPTVTLGSVRFPGKDLPRVKVDDESL